MQIPCPLEKNKPGQSPIAFCGGLGFHEVFNVRAAPKNTTCYVGMARAALADCAVSVDRENFPVMFPKPQDMLLESCHILQKYV